MPTYYFIRFAPTAERDLSALYRYISGELKMPATADSYIEGIYNAIYSLSNYAGIYPISQRESVQRLYGPFARTIRYKKFSIIYNIIGHEVLIRRVIAGSLIV